MPKSFMIFHGIECSLFFFLSTCAFTAYFLFRFVVVFFFSSFLVLIYRLFFSVCVFLLCHLRDSVHILAAFSTIIFPFVVLCFYCLLLFFVVVFFFLFFFHFYGRSPFFYRDFVSVCDIGKTHLYAFFFCFHQSTIFFYLDEKQAICMCLFTSTQHHFDSQSS